MVKGANSLLQDTVSLDANKLFLATLKDSETVFKGIEVDTVAIELPENVELDEYQYYIHKVGFFLIHTITWCKQLSLAIEFFSNFDYSKKINATRADHLIYNLENYFIRLNSVNDRVLQIVNAVFHLCISEEHVNYSVIISNYKIQHRKLVCSKIKKIRKYLDKYAQTRHTLIHKHSYMDLDLRRIELFYLADLKNNSRDKILKTFRANRLRDYISERKELFSKINTGLFIHLNELFDLLLEEYERQKAKLR